MAVRARARPAAMAAHASVSSSCTAMGAPAATGFFFSGFSGAALATGGASLAVGFAVGAGADAVDARSGTPSSLLTGGGALAQEAMATPSAPTEANVAKAIERRREVFMVRALSPLDAPRKKR